MYPFLSKFKLEILIKNDIPNCKLRLLSVSIRKTNEKSCNKL